MVRILCTGDLHLGRLYAKKEKSQIYIKARMDALKNLVKIANEKKCDFIVVTGDLYDRVSAIPVSLHEEVADVLDNFEGQAVIIIPGNHDYYDADSDKLWSDFERKSKSNTRDLKSFERFEIGDVVFYPCFCQAKTSSENALGWVKEDLERDPSKINVGIAHGAIEGVSIDSESKYYKMSIEEL